MAFRRWARAGFLAITLAWCGAQLSGCSCEATCGNDGAGTGGPLNLSNDNPARVKVTACRNGSCGEARFDSTTIQPPSNTLGANFRIADDVTVNCQLSDPGPSQATWDLHVLFTAGEDTDLEDGDTYRILVFDEEAQADLLRIEKKVTH